MRKHRSRCNRQAAIAVPRHPVALICDSIFYRFKYSILQENENFFRGCGDCFSGCAFCCCHRRDPPPVQAVVTRSRKASALPEWRPFLWSRLRGVPRPSRTADLSAISQAAFHRSHTRGSPCSGSCRRSRPSPDCPRGSSRSPRGSSRICHWPAHGCPQSS